MCNLTQNIGVLILNIIPIIKMLKYQNILKQVVFLKNRMH